MSKTIFITGATSGFGKATAKRFAEDGWKLIILGRREGRLEELAQTLSNAAVHSICADLRNEMRLKSALAELPEDFRAIDVLLNNAGLALGLSSADTCDLADWDTMVDTNIKALTHCTRHLLPSMVARGSGHIINISSTAAQYPYPGGNVYGATKAFVSHFSKNLRADLLGTGIRVTNIEPGMAESEFSLVRFKGDESAAEQVYEGTEPLKPEDIAEAIYWAVHQPTHVNINNIELMPVCQSWGPLAVQREKI